ncbi:MAG: DUF2231 domain-containing protein [Pseudomonadota bacterium]|nr:DUF2231 domain-containing protein [Pseudomonadota bacterium]
MRTPASIAGHPIHAMLIVFPVGLLIFSLICDLISLNSAAPANWVMVAFYTMVGGFIGALAAAVPGLVDLLSLTDRAIKKTAITHMSINLVVVALYAVNIWMRVGSGTNSGTPLVLSLVAVAMLAVSGWLGGKMVHEAGVGVDVSPR